MLTYSDLKKIGEVIDTRIEANLKPIRNDLTAMKHDIAIIKKNDMHVLKNQDVMLKMLNEDDMMLFKRVKRIEEHLGFPQQK